MDIDDFTYEILDNDRIKVCIDLSLTGEEIVIRDKDEVRDLKEIYGMDDNNVTNNIDVNNLFKTFINLLLLLIVFI